MCHQKKWSLSPRMTPVPRRAAANATRIQLANGMAVRRPQNQMSWMPNEWKAPALRVGKPRLQY